MNSTRAIIIKAKKNIPNPREKGKALTGEPVTNPVVNADIIEKSKDATPCYYNNRQHNCDYACC